MDHVVREVRCERSRARSAMDRARSATCEKCDASDHVKSDGSLEKCIEREVGSAMDRSRSARKKCVFDPRSIFLLLLLATVVGDL